jgi:hypothetical protein
MHMQTRIAVLSAFLSVLVACGGGSTTPTTGTAALSGLVYEVDGQTVDRSGVQVRVVETGDTAVTGADGRFRLDGIPAGTVTLQFASTGAALAQAGPGDDAPGSEVENEDEDDGNGNPQVTLPADAEAEVRASMSGGSLAEFALVKDDRVRAETRLTRTVAATGQEGKIRVEQRADREKFDLEVEQAAQGDAFDVYLIDPDTGDRTFIERIVAGIDGEAELERNTNDGDQLPLGASTVDELVGFGIEVEFGGDVILTGTVPELPDWVPGTGDDPTPTGDARGKARLTAVEAGLEGSVEIERDPDDGEQEFEMEAEHLGAGRVVRFEIRNPDTGEFETLRTIAADDSGEAEFESEDGPLPLGVDTVDDLVGLDVRVVDDGTGDVLLTGTVPELVAD